LLSSKWQYAEGEYKIFNRQSRKLIDGTLDVSKPTILEFSPRTRELPEKLAIETA